MSHLAGLEAGLSNGGLIARQADHETRRCAGRQGLQNPRRSQADQNRRAADALPRDRFDAFILLAKLAPFSDHEIALARTLNSQYRRRVIMLTARELEPYHFFERTKKEFPTIKEHGSSPEDLALVTAQIYFSKVK